MNEKVVCQRKMEVPAPTTYLISFIRRVRSESFGSWGEEINLNIEVRKLYEFANDPSLKISRKKAMDFTRFHSQI